jgi:hypothetical protein
MPGVLLKVAKGDPVKGFLNRCQKSFGVGPVRSLRVAASAVEPKLDQVLVRIRLLGGNDAGRCRRDHRIVRRFVRMQDNVPSRA